MSYLFSTVPNSLLIASSSIRNWEQQKVGTGGKYLAGGKTFLDLAHRSHDRPQHDPRPTSSIQQRNCLATAATENDNALSVQSDFPVAFA
jgi:hypothetical protein